MFGSTLVEPYIGELGLAQTADTMMKDGANDTTTQEEYESMTEEEREKVMDEKIAVMQAESEFKKAKRQVTCAKNLRKRVQPYLDLLHSSSDNNKKDAKIKFREDCTEEAVKIAQGSQGDFYLKTIGFALEVNAGSCCSFLRFLVIFFKVLLFAYPIPNNSSNSVLLPCTALQKSI